MLAAAEVVTSTPVYRRPAVGVTSSYLPPVRENCSMPNFGGLTLLNEYAGTIATNSPSLTEGQATERFLIQRLGGATPSTGADHARSIASYNRLGEFSASVRNSAVKAANGCGEVHLHNLGEPLLDRQLEDKIRYAKERKIKKVRIFTNGSLLTASRSRSLIQAGLDEFAASGAVAS